MHALATFDRWIEARRQAARDADRGTTGRLPSAPQPASLPAPLDEEALTWAVRQRWQVSSADWLHVLVQERAHHAGGDQWGLALWRQGCSQPEWLACWPFAVRGCPPATLRTQLLRLALATQAQPARSATLH